MKDELNELNGKIKDAKKSNLTQEMVISLRKDFDALPSVGNSELDQQMITIKNKHEASIVALETRLKEKRETVKEMAKDFVIGDTTSEENSVELNDVASNEEGNAFATNFFAFKEGAPTRFRAASASSVGTVHTVNLEATNSTDAATPSDKENTSQNGFQKMYAFILDLLKSVVDFILSFVSPKNDAESTSTPALV